MIVFWYKSALAVASLGALGAAHLWLRNEVRARAAARWLNVPLCWVATRLLPWVGIYLVARFATGSDVATVYWPQATATLGGGIPYRDYASSFGPLFPALLALPLLVWRDPRSIVLFLSVLEAATVALTLRAGRVAPGTGARARWLAYYFLAPGPLLLAVVGGQEDFLLWTGGLLLWLTVARGFAFTAGSLATACAMATKPLFAIPAAAFAGLGPRRIRFLGGAALPALAVLAGLRLLTGTRFLGVLGESRNVSPPNLWIWLHWLSGGRVPIGNPRLSLVMIAATVLFAAGYFARHRAAILAGPRGLFAAWTVVFTIFMLINLKSMGAYVGYFALPALALVVDPVERPMLVAWVVLGALAPIESSVWYRTGERLLTGLPDSPWLAVEYAMQGTMLACLILLALGAHRALRQPAVGALAGIAP